MSKKSNTKIPQLPAIPESMIPKQLDLKIPVPLPQPQIPEGSSEELSDSEENSAPQEMLQNKKNTLDAKSEKQFSLDSNGKKVLDNEHQPGCCKLRVYGGKNPRRHCNNSTYKAGKCYYHFRKSQMPKPVMFF